MLFVLSETLMLFDSITPSEPNSMVNSRGRVRLEDEAFGFRVSMAEIERLSECIEWIDLSFVERRRTPEWAIQVGIRCHLAGMSTRNASQLLDEDGYRFRMVPREIGTLSNVVFCEIERRTSSFANSFNHVEPSTAESWLRALAVRHNSRQS